MFDMLVYYFVQYLSIYGEDEYDDMLGYYFLYALFNYLKLNIILRSMRVVPRTHDDAPSPAAVETPLLNDQPTSSPAPSLPSSSPPPLNYAELQRPGFKKIFNPTPDNSVPPSPTTLMHPVSPTTERVLSPDNLTSSPERSPPQIARNSRLPAGAVPSILRTISPVSEESTTSSPLPESPPQIKPGGFRAKFMKIKPLPALEIIPQPGTSEEMPMRENGPVTKVATGNNNRPMSPETDF